MTTLQMKGIAVNRAALVRALNERIAKKATEHRFIARVPMLCECDDTDCQESFLIGLDSYREVVMTGGVLTVPGHQVDGAETGLQNGDYWCNTATVTATATRADSARRTAQRARHARLHP